MLATLNDWLCKLVPFSPLSVTTSNNKQGEGRGERERRGERRGERRAGEEGGFYLDPSADKQVPVPEAFAHSAEYIPTQHHW